MPKIRHAAGLFILLSTSVQSAEPTQWLELEAKTQPGWLGHSELAALLAPDGCTAV